MSDQVTPHAPDPSERAGEGLTEAEAAHLQDVVDRENARALAAEAERDEAIERIRKAKDTWERDRAAATAAEAERDRLRGAVERVTRLVEPQWRLVPTDLPDSPVAAYSEGRNWMIDHIREALEQE